MIYSKNQINRAGDILKSRDTKTAQEISWAENVLTYWRTIHGHPINTFQATLRKKIKKIWKKAIVAQRLKRSASIISKLRRQKNMKLSTMQDIAWLRAVLNNVDDVRKLESSYTDKFPHKLINKDDYISSPKKSGYRSIHLIYLSKVDELKIEIQLRTKLQHHWATAVETMWTFLDTSLKSSEWSTEILDFFCIASSAFAILENSPRVPKHNSLEEQRIFQEVLERYQSLGIEDKLRWFTVAASKISEQHEEINSKYHLIILNLDKKTVTLRNFTKKQLEDANKAYTEIEREIADGASIQAVLVSIDSIESLRKAYPNYFLDTREFLQTMDRISQIVNAK